MNPHQPLLDKLAEAATLSPDVRFGQVLANIGLLPEDSDGSGSHKLFRR